MLSLSTVAVKRYADIRAGFFIFCFSEVEIIFDYRIGLMIWKISIQFRKKFYDFMSEFF